MAHIVLYFIDDQSKLLHHEYNAPQTSWPPTAPGP